MKYVYRKLALVALPTLFAIQGCHVSQVTLTTTTTCTVSGAQAGACSISVGGTTSIVPDAQMQTVGASDLSTLTDGSYTVSVSAPASAFAAATGATYGTSISAITDTGYSSTITLPLTPTTPAISPVNGGDAVYSFNLPNTPQLTAWIQQVSANTSSSMTLKTTAGLPFQMIGGPGTYTITTELSSNSTGNTGKSNVQTTWVEPPTSPCGTGHVKCIDPGV